jgi:MFS transporter, DHA2 family, multidrug resistance protein
LASVATGTSARKPVNKFGITITAMLAMISMIMSSTMVNVAIPDIMGAFGIGQDRAHWISTGFLSAMTAGMLLNAWLVTNFGPRNVFISALALFSITAFAGQYAPTFEGIVAARFMQGLCAGLIQPLAMSTVFLAYPPNERGVAMGWFGMGIVFGPTIGPVLGGLIIDAVHWRFVFAAPVPIMFLAAGLAWFYMPGRDETTTRASFNLFSFLLVTAAIMMFLNGISMGQREGWESTKVFGLLFASACALIAFLVREVSSDAPLLQLKLFKSRTYVAAAVIGFVFGAGMFGSLYIVPVMVQTVQGFTALKAGLMLLPGGIVSMLVFPIAGRLSTMVQPVYTIGFGLAAFGASCLLLASSGISTAFWTMAFMVAFGRIGLGLVVPSLNLSAMAAAPRELVPYAAGTLNFIRLTGASIGVSALALIIDGRGNTHGDTLRATQTADNPVTREMLTAVAERLEPAGLSDIDRASAAMVYLKNALLLKSQELAFQDGHLALVALFSVGIGTTLLMLRR